jgi:uncharacterized protein YoxC
MNQDEIAGKIAALIEGGKFTGKTLDRHERKIEGLESEIKELKNEKVQIEKQYAGLFSELQHKLNEVEELQSSVQNVAAEVIEFRQDCNDHKRLTANKSAWQTIKTDPVKALKIVGYFFIVFIIGSIVGWDKLILWLARQVT